MLKKLFLSTGATVLFWSFIATPALALNTTEGLSEAGGDAGYNISQDLPQIVGGIIDALLGILGVLFLVLTIYAGFLWMTAAGDEKKVGKAKAILQSALIGLVLILAAYAITDFVVRALTSATTGTSY